MAVLKSAMFTLHIVASSIMSNAEVAHTLLWHYSFATAGKNRFEITPLGETSLQVW